MRTRPRCSGAALLAGALVLQLGACGADDDAETADEATPAAEWSYEGEAGPARWGDLDPAFAACGDGTEQSPIDVAAPDDAELADLDFAYGPSTVEIVDNGHTVQATVSAGNRLAIDGQRYDLAQLHFHAPSEHTIEGASFDMEMHLVHLDADGAIAVVAVMISAGSTHPEMAAFWENLPKGEGTPVPLDDALDLSSLLPAQRHTYRYEGSLTTPPCTEGVAWHLMTEGIEMSAQQIGAFTERHNGNNRPLAPTDERTVVHDLSE